jgi:hypothetical protein
MSFQTAPWVDQTARTRSAGLVGFTEDLFLLAILLLFFTLANYNNLHVHGRVPPARSKLQRTSLACVFLVAIIALGIGEEANWISLTRVTQFIGNML